MKRGTLVDWDEAKAALNVERGRTPFDDVDRFDFATALIFEDTRRDYGETRMTAIGRVEERLHVLVYTSRAERLRVISFRRANDREQRRYDRETLDRNRN